MSTNTSTQYNASSDKEKYSPLDWRIFFETKRQISIPIELDPTQITFTVYETNREEFDLPVILLHHGAGHCALSFAVAARELKALVGDKVRIVSFDIRGHGETTSTEQHNLDIDRLAKDLQNLLLTLYTPTPSVFEGTTSMPELLLVGHSLGGSVVIEAASRELIPNVTGVAVLDTALVNRDRAMVNIRRWCESRPDPCHSVEQAIQWAIDSGTVKNLESARVSFPGMVKASPTDSTYTWHTDLLKSDQYWATWFNGLNQKFLSIKARKLLVFAAHNDLDDELKNSYEQGKFIYSKFNASGHAVEEDEPIKLAKELIALWKKD
ncbi:hypothetical protein BGZ76_004650 [Entomortierella beljakovae]|nr:hypothetical protein BGZ76_004650 [Entomortierella beljakovae]